MTAVVDSIRNPLIVRARSLTTRASREAAGSCLVEGATLIGQTVNSGADIEYVLCPEDADDPVLQAELSTAGVDVHPVRAGLLRKLAAAGRSSEWLAIARLPAERTRITGSVGDFVVVCEHLDDPGNLGTVIRAARALGAGDVVLTDPETDVSARKVISAARGALPSGQIHRFPNSGAAVAALRARGFQIVATSPRGAQLQATAPLGDRRVALIVGNEAEGVSCDDLGRCPWRDGVGGPPLR